MKVLIENQRIELDTIVIHSSLLTNDSIRFAYKFNIRILTDDNVPPGNIDMFFQDEFVGSYNINAKKNKLYLV